MTSSDVSSPAAGGGDFAHWIEEKAQALKFELGDKFPVPPTVLASPARHPETGHQKLEEVLLEHESPTQDLLDEVAALEAAAPLSDDELTRQALLAGGSDSDPATPE